MTNSDKKHFVKINKIVNTQLNMYLMNDVDPVHFTEQHTYFNSAYILLF